MPKDKSSRSLIWLLASALGAALLIWVFWLGRASSPQPESSARNAELTEDAAKTPADVKAGPGADNERATDAEASEYFRRIRAIQGSSEESDPEVLAMAIMQASMQGDARRLDSIIEDSARMLSEAEQVQAPPCCEAHHRATVEMMVESQKMLEALREDLVSKGLQDPSALSGHIQSLEAKTRALRQMEAQILAGQ